MIHIAQFKGQTEPLVAGTAKVKIYHALANYWTTFKKQEDAVVYTMYPYKTVPIKEEFSIRKAVELYREIYDLAKDIRMNTHHTISLWSAEMRKEVRRIKKSRCIRGHNIDNYMFNKAFYDAFFGKTAAY